MKKKPKSIDDTFKALERASIKLGEKIDKSLEAKLKPKKRRFKK